MTVLDTGKRRVVVLVSNLAELTSEMQEIFFLDNSRIDVV